MPLMAEYPAAMDELVEHDPSIVQINQGQIPKINIKDTENLRATPKSSQEKKAERDSGYKDFDALDQVSEDSDMEDSILHRPRPKKQTSTNTLSPPVVPARSDKRGSRILENMLVELQSLDGSVPSKDLDRQSVNDPHELYLSSEEEGSLSDHYEDYDFSSFDLQTEDRNSKTGSRGSTSSNDTARIVSFTLITRPQITKITIQSKQRTSTPPRSSSMPQSTSYIPPSKATRRAAPAPLKVYPSNSVSYSNRRMSISSTLSQTLTQHSNASLTSFPVRKSSRLNLSSIVLTAKNSFLSSDPFASSGSARAGDGNDAEEVPKTPTSIAAAAWKKGFSRTINMARKPSMPKLSLAYQEGERKEESSNRESLRLARGLALQEKKEMVNEGNTIRRSETMPALNSEGLGRKSGDGWRYQDIMRNVIKAPPPPQRFPAKERKSSLSMGLMGLGRKKSVKEKEDTLVG